MDTETIRVLLPVAIQAIKLISDLADDDIDGLTIAEVKAMLQEVQWPDLEFKSTKE